MEVGSLMSVILTVNIFKLNYKNDIRYIFYNVNIKL